LEEFVGSIGDVTNKKDVILEVEAAVMMATERMMKRSRLT